MNQTRWRNTSLSDFSFPILHSVLTTGETAEKLLNEKFTSCDRPRASDGLSILDARKTGREYVGLLLWDVSFCFDTAVSITVQLIKDAGFGEQIGWIDANRFPEVRQAHSDGDHFKVIKVHRCTDAMMAEFRQENALGIYAFRDIRDVYASMQKQRQKSFDVLWQGGFI